MSITIPARKGKAAFVNEGQQIRLINTHGHQVVDTWTFNRHDLREFMSMEHCRVTLGIIYPRAGQTMVTNKRRPILTIVEDTSGGVHDTLAAACDIYRYQLLGCEEYHDNCTDNLAAAFKELNLELPETPCPFNIFQNTPVDPNTSEMLLRPPIAEPGQYVLLRAEMDIVIAVSCCPQDILPVNGPQGGRPTEAHFQLI